MLSQEIYDSWNAKTVADLKALLDSINGPAIPKDVQSKVFKEAVLQKVDKRRHETASNQNGSLAFDTLDDDAGGCFSWLCPHKISEKDRQWRQYDCKSITTFESLCFAANLCFSGTIASVKALIQKLSYWESLKPGTDGLSVVGGYIWILSFGCQHLIDCPNEKLSGFSMQTHIVKVKEKYQELSQAGELFAELAETFHEHTHRMRADALQVLKKLMKRWAIKEEYNPLFVRPETIKPLRRPRRRQGNGLDCPVDGEDDDDVFSVKWSPLTIFIQMQTGERLKPFGRLHPQDRVTIFQKFLRCTLDKVEMAAEDLTTVSNQVAAIELDSERKLHGREVVAALLNFTKGSYVPKTIADKDRRRIVQMLNLLWYSLDVLHENAYDLLRLVQETRDIIRTCYVYADIFYKWHMPSYDTFITKTKGKQKARSSSLQAKEILNKLGNQKKLSETANIMSLMDFSSSIYQGVVQEIPVECDGMLLRLSIQDVDLSSEPSGLVTGVVDTRKSTVLTDGKKVDKKKH